MSVEKDMFKLAGEIGADAMEAYELLDQKLRQVNVIVRRYASREEQIELDIDGALAEAERIRMGKRSAPAHPYK